MAKKMPKGAKGKKPNPFAVAGNGAAVKSGMKRGKKKPKGK